MTEPSDAVQALSDLLDALVEGDESGDPGDEEHDAPAEREGRGKQEQAGEDGANDPPSTVP